MDEDGKWDQMVHACEKVEGILTAIMSDARKEEEGEARQENVIKLTQQGGVRRRRKPRQISKFT